MQRPRIILAFLLAALVSSALGASSTSIALHRRNVQLDGVASRASQNVVCESSVHERIIANFFRFTEVMLM